MSPEQTQNQYYGQAERQEMKEQMERAQKDPSSVDPDQLERDLIARLEKAAGSKRLNDKGFRDYEKARDLIKKEVQKLRQVRQFFANRLKIEMIDKAATTRTPDERVDYSNRVRQETQGLEPTPYTRQMVMAWDFAFLNKFINQPDSGLPEELKVTMLLVKGKAIDTRRNLALALSDHYHEIFPGELNKIDQKLEGTVGRAENGLANVSMLDYVDIDNDISDIEMYLRDRQDLLAAGSKSGGGPAFDTLRDPVLELACADAERRVLEMREKLIEARQYMKPDERFAVENQERASKAVARGDKGAKGWERAAWDRKLLIVVREQAESNALRAFALGSDGALYAGAQAKMAEAAKAASKDQVAANRLYTEANEMFREARKVYVTAQREKKRKPGNGPSTRDQRLASRK